jgi:hypothetical protein
MLRGGLTGVFLTAILLAATSARADESDIAGQLAGVFLRSMEHHGYDYGAMDPKRGAVACIDWDAIDQAFLDDGIFEALGFSFSVGRDEMALQIATQGCQNMARHYKLETCACLPVMIDDTSLIEVPPATAERLR